MTQQSTSDFQEIKRQLPKLGVGLGLRRSIFSETLEHTDLIDWVEIVPENYMGKGGRNRQILKETMAAGLPIVTHGVDLSIGSIDPLNPDYVAELKDLFHVINPPWFSDHLCFTSVDGAHFNDLIPLPFTWEAVHHVVKKIQCLQAQFDIPFLVENISYYCSFGEYEMDEAQFFTEVVERANCGIMLDVNNVYVNAQNHGYNPIEFLDNIPMERVVQLHIAGHLRRPHMIIDTHGEAVCTEVWAILDEVLKRTPVHAILLERDQNFPDFDELKGELRHIRGMVDTRQPDMYPASGQSTVRPLTARKAG